MRLTLLCHAATAATRAARFPADEPLDAKALDGLDRRPPRLLKHDRCLTSPARCARQSAEALGLTPVVDDGLRDADHGRWAGLSLAALAAEEPAALDAWLHDPRAAPHGGETLDAVIGRVGLWLDARLRDTGSLVAVTHASVIRAAIVHVIGAPAPSFWRIDVAPLAVATLSGRGGRWTVCGLTPA